MSLSKNKNRKLQRNKDVKKHKSLLKHGYPSKKDESRTNKTEIQQSNRILESNREDSNNNFNSKLKEIYEEKNEVELRTSDFIENATRSEIQNEVEYLAHILKSRNFSLEISLFICEVLSAFHYDYSFIKLIYQALEKKSSHKYSIYKLRLLNCLQAISLDKFIPISSYLIEIIKRTFDPAKSLSDRVITLRNLKISNDNINDNFNSFVQSKALKLLFRHLNSQSNSISFPELTYFVIKKLESFKDSNEINALIQKLQVHSQYIEKERQKIRNEAHKKVIKDFESSLRNMSDKQA